MTDIDETTPKTARKGRSDGSFVEKEQKESEAAANLKVRGRGLCILPAL